MTGGVTRNALLIPRLYRELTQRHADQSQRDRRFADMDTRGRSPRGRYRRVTVFCAVVAAGLTALALGSRWFGRERPRNVVLVSVDTLRRGSLRSFQRDAAPLPNLDGLARRSVIFETALSPAAWTLPAHASLLTGLYPDRHGAIDPRRRIAENVPTLARELRQQAISLAAIARGRWYIQAASGDEIYDLEADPGQHRSLTDVDPAPLRDLVLTRREYHLPPGTRGPDRALDDRLRALGYVQ